MRINRRLYANGGNSGPYTIPDVYFPQSNLILDGTIGTKSINTAQVRNFRLATGNAPVDIIRPEAYGGSYTIG